MVTTRCRSLICAADEVPELAGPGRGVTVIKVDEGDGVLGFGVGKDDEIVMAETESGKKIPVGPGHDEVTSRGGKGRQIAKKTTIVRVVSPDAAANPKLLN